MAKLNEALRILDPAHHKDELVIANQTTNDIINQVLYQHKENRKQAKQIAHLFDGGNLYETCKNIWNFLKYEVPYSVEPSSKQTTKTISRMLTDAKQGKGSDCKHYSGFAGNILEACGYGDWCYRFAGYSDHSNLPTHVYVVANDDEGKIFVDAVIGYFDTEKPYKIKIDKQMSLYKLSGVDDAEVNGIRDVAKKVGTKVSSAAKEIKNKALTLSLVIPRGAFLALLKFNVHGWATGLSKMSYNELSWWVDWFGGNRTELMNAIADGAKRKRILGDDDDGSYIGEPVTIAASLASATPIIAKITDVLMKAEKIHNDVEKVTGSKTAQAIKKGAEDFKKITGKSVSDVIFKKDAGKTSTSNALQPTDFKVPTDAEANKVADAIINKTYTTPSTNRSGYLLPLGIGVGLLILLNK